MCLIAVFLCVCLMAVLLLPLGIHQETTSNGSLSDPQNSTSGEILGGRSSSKIVLNAVMMKAPNRVMVYKTQPTVVTKADAVEFAKKFNIIDINEPKEGDAVISVSSKDMRYRAMLYRNGGQLYEDSGRVDTPNDADFPENLPSDKDAEKIATAFLKAHDLLPDGAVFSKSTHDKTYKLNRSGGEPTVVRENIELGYSRELNGMKVEGTQFMVGVGAHGDIISFFVNWKEYEPIVEYPIKSGESAFDELKQKGIAVSSGPVKPDTISIDQAYLAYYTKALAYPEDYLEPVWVFKGTALADGKSVAPITEYIPALTDEAMKSLLS